MTFSITLDPYTIGNLINALLTLFIIIGCTIWLVRFAKSAIRHRDKIGVFLVVVAVLMLVMNLFSITTQIGQALGLTEWRVGFTAARMAERVLSLILVISLFQLGKVDG